MPEWFSPAMLGYVQSVDVTLNFIKPVYFVFYSESGQLLLWLFKQLPFNVKYSFKLVDLASSFNKKANDLLLEDINKERLYK